MKLCSIILCFCLIAQIAFCPWANAAVNYSPADTGQSKISGAVNVKGVGKVSGSGTADFQGDRLAIILGADLTTKTPSLTGTTFNTHKDDHNDRLTGLVFFNGGTQITKLDDRQTPDVVETEGGDQISGRITDVSDGLMKIDTSNGTKTVNTSEIKTVKSSRVFEFHMTLTGDLVSFTSTGKATMTASARQTTTAKTTKSGTTPSGSRRRTVKRVILVVVVLCVIATAIAVPVAVSCAQHHHSSEPTTMPIALIHPKPAPVVDSAP